MMRAVSPYTVLTHTNIIYILISYREPAVHKAAKYCDLVDPVG